MLIGFDNDDKLVKFLSDGVIAGLVVQDPFRMGYDGVKTALAASSPFDGAILLTTINNGANLLYVDSYLQRMITGGLIILIVYFDQLRRRKG
jgi:ribose transport system substrate-binding protein